MTRREVTEMVDEITSLADGGGGTHIMISVAVTKNF